MEIDVRNARRLILVEGASDQNAIEALARRRGRDLVAEGIVVLPMGGAKSIRTFVERFGPQGRNLALSGLCDAGEERDFQRALERAGFGARLTRDDLERLGFYVCVKDLEDELIRGLGEPAVERVLEAHGELESFRSLQRQPAWRDRPAAEQLRRFFGTHAGRKARFATILTEAIDLARVPRPLERVLAHG